MDDQQILITCDLTNNNYSLLPLGIAYIISTSCQVLKVIKLNLHLLLKFAIPKIANIVVELLEALAIMKAFFLLLTIWINWIALANLVSAQAPRRPPPPPKAPPPPPPIQKTSTLDLNQPTTYRTFITDVRNKLAEKDAKGNYVLKCTMQKISKVVPPEGFMYVQLIASSSKMITLALDLSNAYVIGYMDKFNNKDRAFFFKEYYAKPSLIGHVFPTATGKEYRLDLGFTGRYQDLEKYGDRRSTPLGISKLQSSITDIYGKNVKDIQKGQRKFLLVAVQMVSEAARFTYISDKIPQAAGASLTVDDRVLALENGWDPLSTAVYQSKTSTTTTTKCALKQPVSLTLDQGNKWTFNTVEDIKQVIGILKAEGTTLFTDNDDGAVEFW